MKVIFECILTFFQMCQLSQVSPQPAAIGLATMATTSLNRLIFPQFIVNFMCAVSFFVTGYRPFMEVLVVLALKIVGALLSAGFMSLLGDPQPPFVSDGIGFWKIFFLEVIYNFFIALAYYCAAVDLKNKERLGNSVAVGCLQGVAAIAFPHLPIGRVMQLLASFTVDGSILFGSLLGGLFGTVLGGILYKSVICDNYELSIREIDHQSKEIKVPF